MNNIFVRISEGFTGMMLVKNIQMTTSATVWFQVSD